MAPIPTSESARSAAVQGDDAAGEARFNELIAADQRVEPRDWMPERLPQDADPPDLAARALRDHRDAAGGQLDHPGAEPQAQGDPDGQGAGRGRPRALPLLRRPDPRHHPRRDDQQLIDGKAKYSSIFNYPTPTWADMGAIGWLVDGAAICNQVPLCRASYGPYGRAMVRICKEESFHQRQGFEILLALMQGTAGAARDGAGCRQPLVLAVADDVRPARRRVAELGAVDGVEDQALLERRAAAAVRRRCSCRRPRCSA